MSAYSSAVLALSPLLYWRLGESAGSTAADASGNSRDGTYFSGITLAQTGLLTGDADTSVSFDGGANALVGSSYAAYAGQRTFCGWATRESGAQAIFTGSSPFLFASTTDVTFYNNFPTESKTWTAALPGTGITFFWALTYDDSTRVPELFINGVSQGAKTAFGAGYAVSPGNFNLDQTGGNSHWNGKQDEVAIFGSILSATDILNLYTVGTTGPAPDTVYPRDFGQHTIGPF